MIFISTHTNDKKYLNNNKFFTCFLKKKKKSSSHVPLKNNKNSSYVCAFYFSLLEYLSDFMFNNLFLSMS